MSILVNIPARFDVVWKLTCPRVAATTEYPRGIRGGAATRLLEISSSCIQLMMSTMGGTVAAARMAPRPRRAPVRPGRGVLAQQRGKFPGRCSVGDVLGSRETRQETSQVCEQGRNRGKKVTGRAIDLENNTAATGGVLGSCSETAGVCKGAEGVTVV